MELIDLFNKHDWNNPSDKMDEKDISQAMKSGVERNAKILYSTYHRSIYLNLLFLIIIWLVYWIMPTLEVLIPILLISSCFLFIIINIATQLINLKSVDASLNLKSVIENTLTFNAKVFEKQCKYNSILLSCSFAGGFLLGMAIQGWTFEKFQQKPIILLVTAILTVLFYFYTKSKSFSRVNRVLNPRFFSAKKYLEEQLNYLKEIEEK